MATWGRLLQWVSVHKLPCYYEITVFSGLEPTKKQSQDFCTGALGFVQVQGWAWLRVWPLWSDSQSCELTTSRHVSAPHVSFLFAHFWAELRVWQHQVRATDDDKWVARPDLQKHASENYGWCHGGHIHLYSQSAAPSFTVTLEISYFSAEMVGW